MVCMESERLTIRPFQESDFADTFAIYRQAEVCRFLLHEPWQTETAAAAFAKKCQQHALTDQAGLSLAVLHDQTVIGDLSVWSTGQPSSVEIGYAFHPSFGGQGFAQEALNELLGWLFASQKIHRVQATLDARNQASAKLCQRIGLRQEAHFIQDWWNKGEWTDSLVFACLASEHPAHPK